MNLPELNAHYIKQLNDNIKILQGNIDAISTINRENARDLLALQRAVLKFLAVKGIIEGEEDIRTFQRLHMTCIAELDQIIAKKRDQSGDNLV